MSVALEITVACEIPRQAADTPAESPVRGEEADAELVSRAQTGEMDAFEALVRRYRNDVYALAYHFVRNREVAWDVAQEVFIKAHRALDRFRGDASFKTWLMRITANQCKDFLKKRRLETVAYDDALQASEAPSHILGPDRVVEAKELGEAITKALEKLPFKHRTAFVLREFEGLSYEEMAQAMDCSLGTVMSRLHHARKKLQRNLLQMGFTGV